MSSYVAVITAVAGIVAVAVRDVGRLAVVIVAAVRDVKVPRKVYD